MSGLEELFTDPTDWGVEWEPREEFLERDVPRLLQLLAADGKGEPAWKV